HCLNEFNYFRKIWDWDIVQACALHQCKLIHQCPNCQKKIKWARPGISQCKCGFDFRCCTSEKADVYQVNLSLYIHQLDNNFKKSIDYVQN
ncbi:TniQ family protein, partial [Dulcicalothrix desertica]